MPPRTRTNVPGDAGLMADNTVDRTRKSMTNTKDVGSWRASALLADGTPTGLYDSNGREIKIGDLVQKPVTCGTRLHGEWSRMRVACQGVVPILLYEISQTGAQLPFGYLACPLSGEYDVKTLLWAKDLSRVLPEESLVVVDD